ncbi:MAG: S8 family serine peptidase [Candidatus Eisenbacteria bacterium]
MSAASRAKLDPSILAALSSSRESVRELEAAGRSLAIYGTSPEELIFPVLIQSDLSDAELAGLGAKTRTRAGDIVTAMVAEGDLDRIGSHPLVHVIEGSYRMGTFLDQSLAAIGATNVNEPPLGFAGEGVILGLLDDGIDITHDDFKDGSGDSRILYVWDQAAESGTPPTGFGYGAEYTKDDIDTGRTDLDDFANYEGHGSHVAGIAVGDGSGGSAAGTYRGVAWQADIIAVRNWGCDLFCYGGAPWQSLFGGGSTVESVDALKYFTQKARALGKRIVVNQSQGVTMGPHDGSSLFETAYNSFIAQNDLIVVVAAGNDQTSAWHSVANVGAGQSRTFTIRHEVNSDTNEPYDLLRFELWWDPGQTYEVTLVSPGGSTLVLPIDTSSSGSPVRESGLGNGNVLYYTTRSYPGNAQGNAWVMFTGNPYPEPIELGNWQVRVLSTNNSAGAVHYYGERGQYGFTVSNPSLDSNLGMPASAENVISVASFNTRFRWPSLGGPRQIPDSNPLGAVSSFSSNGPRRGRIGPDKPDLAAPGMWIASAMAERSSWPAIYQINDGEHVVLAGTSMAAPHVAGTIALMLEKDPTLTRAQVKQFLIDTADDGGEGWTKTLGWGKLRADSAVNAVAGGTGNCTLPGDANQDENVDVFDVVSTVNHILGRTFLTSDGEDCADLDGSSGITAGDLGAIVSRIMAQSLPRPQLLAASEAPASLAWGELVDGSGYALLFAPEALGVVSFAFTLPRGFELDGGPRMAGTRPGSILDWSEAAGVYKVVAYDPGGQVLGTGAEPVRIELPLVQVWDGDETLDALRVSSFQASDPRGRKLVLEEDATLGLEGGPGTAPALRLSSSPNPMQDVTRIRYELAAGERVEVDVVDAAGRRVRRLASGPQVGGSHTINWDGRDETGTVVPAGVYFIRLETESGIDSRKVQVVR